MKRNIDTESKISHNYDIEVLIVNQCHNKSLFLSHDFSIITNERISRYKTLGLIAKCVIKPKKYISKLVYIFMSFATITFYYDFSHGLKQRLKSLLQKP